MKSPSDKPGESKNTGNRLEKLSEQYRAYQREQLRHTSIKENLRDEKNREDVLQKKLKKESRDVEKMEGVSIKAIFHSILGNSKLQYEKERQEYLAAKLQYDQCCEAIELLQKEEAKLEESIRANKGIIDIYNTAYSEKEKKLLQAGDKRSIQLNNNGEELSKIKTAEKEIGEAIKAGEDVKEQLQRVVSHLKSASGWGTWDLLGGGLLATFAKRSQMDGAKNAMYKAQHLLTLFNNELRDVANEKYDFGFGGFASFADYFFDGLIVDWIVQSGIRKAYDNTMDLFEKIGKVITEMSGKLDNITHKKQGLEAERRRLVETM